MESHEDDIFFFPRKLDDVVPLTLSSSSSSTELDEVKPQVVSKKVRRSDSLVHRDRSKRKHRGTGTVFEDAVDRQDNSLEEDVLGRKESWRALDSLLSKLEENRRRLERFNEEEAAASCDSVDNSVQLGSTDVLDLDNIRVQVQSGNGKEVFCIRRRTSMKLLLLACCKRWGFSESNTVLYFEGRTVNPDTTAEGLGLEDDDLIDVVYKG